MSRICPLIPHRLAGLVVALALCGLALVRPAPVQARVAGGITLGTGGERKLNAMTPPARARELAAMRNDGVTWLRIDASNKRSNSKAIKSAMHAGMHLLIVVQSAHPDASNMAATSTAVVRRYAPLGVNHYEILNEPNIHAGYRHYVPPSRYVSILRASYRAIHAADPGATVISGSLAQAPDNPGHSLEPYTYLRAVLAHAASGSSPVRGLFDAVGVHAYATPDLPEQRRYYNPWNYFPMGSPPADCAAVGPSDCLSTILNEYGDGATKLWITEAGAPTGNAGGYPAQTQRFQAATITQAFALANASPDSGPAVFNYQWQDNKDFDLGLLTAKGIHKLAYRAYADAVHGTSTNATLHAGRSLTDREPPLVNPDSGAELIMQTDGNLVLYDAENNALWSTGTYGHPGAKAKLTRQGALVVTGPGGKTLWTSGKSGHHAKLVLSSVPGAQLTIRRHGVAVWNAGV